MAPSVTLPYTLHRSETGINLLLFAMIVLMALALYGGIFWPDPIIAQLFPVVCLGIFLFGAGVYVWYRAAYLLFTATGITSVNHIGLATTDAEMDWSRIQDVTFKGTFLQSLFNLGTLSFQDAAAKTYFTLSWVARVDQWAAYIEQQAQAHPERVEVTP